MIKNTLLITFIILLFIGCTPYPRYKKHNPTTPSEKNKSDQVLSTDNYLKFGFILQKYLGRPHSSRSAYKKALDCSELVQKIYREYNRSLLPRTAAEQQKLGREIPRRLLRFGDLVFFETVRGKISHVGIYIGDNEFIHASTTRGVIISSLNEPYWSKRYRSVRRIL